MERNFSLLQLAFISIVILGVLHFIAGAFYLYWTLDWYDYMMHFLGGLGGGLIVAWFISNKNISNVEILAIVFVSVMVVGIAWETFEYINGIAQSTEGYTLDTFHDLSMDAIGSLVAAIVNIKKLEWKKLN